MCLRARACPRARRYYTHTYTHAHIRTHARTHTHRVGHVSHDEDPSVALPLLDLSPELTADLDDLDELGYFHGEKDRDQDDQAHHERTPGRAHNLSADGWMDGWMDEWMNRWMDGVLDVASNK